MGDIFRNKFFIISLIIICVLTVSTVALNLSGHGSVVSDITNVVLTPFQRFADIVKNGLSGFSAYFTEIDALRARIADLEAKLEIAEAESENTRQLQEANDNLYNFYGLKRERPLYDLQPARITSRDPGNYLSSLTINRGSLYGLAKNMPVIGSKPSSTGTGFDYIIVGYVSEVGLMSSKVVPFIRTGEAIGAYIGRTQEIGVVEGDFELEKNGVCRIVNLSKETVLEVGDKIYSSGSSIYPENLYIGEVIKVTSDPLSQTMTGDIKPAADFSKIKDVMVILKFERKFY